MEQYDAYAGLLTSVPTVEEVLDDHASELGPDLIAYRNHVYRVLNLCLAFVGHRRVEVEKVAVAAIFHDLGIWTGKTLDYIAPSVALAREHLTTRGLAAGSPSRGDGRGSPFDHALVLICVAPDYRSDAVRGVEGQSVVESFRRADWIDVSRGLRRFGLPRTFVAAVVATWPNVGFHRRLVVLTIDRFFKHPLTPLPMVKW